MSNLSDLIQQINNHPTNGFKNKIINGDFRVTQQGTSKTGSARYDFVDMWRSWVASGTHDCQILPVTLPNNRSTNMMVLTGNDIYALTQTVEYGHRLMHKKNFVLSFWAKADSNVSVNSGNIYDANKGSTSYAGGVIALTTQWQKFEYVYNSPDFSDRLDDEKCIIYPIYNLSPGNVFYIADVQLEEGTKSTEFEEIPFTLEERMCFRYYFSTLNASNHSHAILGKAITTEKLPKGFVFPVQMRIVPTVTIFSDDNETQGSVTRYNAVEDTGSGFTAKNIKKSGFDRISGTSGLTTGFFHTYKFTADARF